MSVIALPKDIVGIIKQNIEYNNITQIYLEDDKDFNQFGRVDDYLCDNRKELYEKLYKMIEIYFVHIFSKEDKIYFYVRDNCCGYAFTFNLKEFTEFDIQKRLTIYFLMLKKSHNIQISKYNINISEINFLYYRCDAKIIACFSSNPFIFDFKSVKSYVKNNMIITKLD